MDELAGRVDILDGGRGVAPKIFSILTLSIFIGATQSGI
jgi:hypothetical protein